MNTQLTRGSRRLAFWACATALALTACATGKSYKTYDDYNPNIDFGRYQTFSFISESPMIVASAQGAVSPLLEGRIMNAVRADLSRKGFRYVPDPEQADMAISFTVGSRDQIRVDQYPATYRTGYGSYYRSYGYGMTYGTETRVRQYTEGQLAIDIFDVRSVHQQYRRRNTGRIPTGTGRSRPAEPGAAANQPLNPGARLIRTNNAREDIAHRRSDNFVSELLRNRFGRTSIPADQGRSRRRKR
jgi:hypothetical protein